MSIQNLVVGEKHAVSSLISFNATHEDSQLMTLPVLKVSKHFSILIGWATEVSVCEAKCGTSSTCFSCPEGYYTLGKTLFQLHH